MKRKCPRCGERTLYIHERVGDVKYYKCDPCQECSYLELDWTDEEIKEADA